MKTIEFKGQVLETKHYADISDEQFLEIRKQYYTKPSKDLVEKEMIGINKGGTKNTNITNFYFKALMSKVKMHHSKWSIEDVFCCKDLVAHFYAKTLTNDKVYPDTDSTIKKIETAFRLGGKGVAAKPSNFPIKEANDILDIYNINDNYYDFSCGWGVRLISSMAKDINYFGTDPNNLLVGKLKEMSNDFKRVCNKDIITDIRCQGSEVFIPEWKNTIGVAFSSPPYFGLEDYRVGEQQSYKEGVTYQEWLDNYLEPTIQNIYKYLTKDGALIININDYSKYKLVEDTKTACENNGFYLYTTHDLKNIQRAKSSGGFNDNSEGIMVFKKR